MGNYKRKDHLYQRAKEEGYRSRAAYKLKELQQKYKLFRKGMRVVDLGSFPGGWLQVALEETAPDGCVLGIDLRDVEQLQSAGRSAIVLKGDLRDEKAVMEIAERTGGKVDVVLSDLSPNLTGVHFQDAARSAELVDAAFEVACRLLKKGGSFVAKIFPGPECEELAKQMKKRFKTFSRPVLGASRKSSKELYFVGRGFIDEGADGNGHSEKNSG